MSNLVQIGDILKTLSLSAFFVVVYFIRFIFIIHIQKTKKRKF